MFHGANIYPKSILASGPKQHSQISPPFAIIGHLPLDHSKHAVIDPIHQDLKLPTPTDWNVHPDQINMSNTPHKPLSHSLSAPEKKIYIFRRKKAPSPRTQSVSGNCLEHVTSRVIKRSGSCTETLVNQPIACNWERNIYPPIQENATETNNLLSPTKIRREGSFKDTTPRSVPQDNFTRPSPLEQSYSSLSSTNTGNHYTSLTNSLPISQSPSPQWNPHTSKASLPSQLYPNTPIEPTPGTPLHMQKGEVGPHGLPVTYHAISSEPPTPSLLPLHRSCEDLLHPTNSPLSEYSIHREPPQLPDPLPTRSLLKMLPL